MWSCAFSRLHRLLSLPGVAAAGGVRGGEPNPDPNPDPDPDPDADPDPDPDPDPGSPPVGEKHASGTRLTLVTPNRGGSMGDGAAARDASEANDDDNGGGGGGESITKPDLNRSV